MIKSKKRSSEDNTQNKNKKLKTTEHSKNEQDNDKNLKNSKKTITNPHKNGFSKKTTFKKGGKTTFNPKNKMETEKPEDWSKYKKEKKQLRLTRKKKKNEDLFELSVQAKKLGEKLRIKTCGVEERNKLCEELHGMLKGTTGDKNRYSRLVLAHDMTRVVQVMLKYSNTKIKNEIMQDLLNSVVLMLQSSYGRFCVKKMFKYGSGEMRRAIIDKFYGNVVKLTSHSLSSSIIDIAYVTWATNVQKNKLKQEFYGDIYKNNKDESISTLTDTYKNSEHMKNAMLCATKANLLKIINKNLLDNALFHVVLYEFMSVCSEEDRTEFISLLCPSIATICSTKEGTKCALTCLWYATNKEKKVILRSIKEHIIKLAEHEHGHMLLLGILCGVDDTVLLNKILVNELVFKATDLIKNEWGRKILLWLVAPMDTTYFHPSVIDTLKEGMKMSSCKKSSETRIQEILDNCKDALCNAITKDSSHWLQSGPVAIVTKAVLKAGSGESLRIALESLAAIITSLEWKVANETNTKVKTQKNAKTDSAEVDSQAEETILGIEHGGLHFVLKKLAQHDKIQIEKEEPTFGEAIVGCLKKKVLKRWLGLNRACFILLSIIENSKEKIKQDLIELLLPMENILKEQTHAGGKILLKHI